MDERTIEILKEGIFRFEEAWNDYGFKCVQTRPASISNLFNDTHRVFLDSISAQLPQAEVLKYRKLFKDLGVASFMSSMNDGKTISLPIGETQVDIVGESTTVYMDTDSWLKAYYAAVISRDRNAINLLCDVPESIFLAANIQPDDFDLAFVRACKGLFDSSANIGQLLVDAMEASAEGNIPEMRLEYAWDLLLPVLMLFRFVIDGDSDNEFNERFEYALEQHRIYWQLERNKDNSTGWKSLPLMAVTVLLYENKGLRMPTENELVPRWIVEDFPGTTKKN